MFDLETIDNCNPPNRMAGDQGFKDKVVLITGGTGFLGKAFIEKLLRTCPMVKIIYVLVRNKKGKNPQERLREVFKNPVFDLLKKLRGEDILKKVTAISGDVSEPDLGLSQQDRKLIIEQVQFIYHMAATTRFDEPLKKAVLFNARGTKLMLQLAKECKQLLFFLYCSTAYCYPQEDVVYERAYAPPADPDLCIQMCEAFDDRVTKAMSTAIMGEHPNSYTFSKALSEALVAKEMDNLPIVIARPSMVINAWKDPIPGWTDNLYGPSGLLVAAAKGVLRTMYCKPDAFMDFMSVDVIAAALICAAWEYMRDNQSKIYNLTSTSEIKVTWKEILELGREIALTEMPLNWVVWYPGGSMKTSRLLHNICVVLFHYIPALFLDTLIFLTGNKPIVWRIQKKISKGFELFEYYANRKWEFNNDAAREARNQLNESEKKLYVFEKTDLDLRDYLFHASHGVRLYILKETDESLPTAKRHIKVMWAVDKICKGLILFGFFYMLYSYFINPSMTN